MNNDLEKSSASALADNETALPQNRSLVDYLRFHLILIYRYRVQFTITCVIVLILGVLYAFFYPATYKSRSKIIAITPPSPLGALSMIGEGTGSAASQLASLTFKTGSREAKLLTILKSRTLALTVYRNSGLCGFLHPDQWNEEANDWVDPEESIPEEALVLEFQNLFTVNLDQELSFIGMSVTLRDPEVAYRVMGQVLVELQNFLNEKSFSLAGKNRVFIENRIAETKNEIEETAGELKKFQEEHNLYDVGTQLAKVVELTAQMEANKVQREISKELLLKYSTNANPKVVLLQQEIDELDAMLSKLTKGTPNAEAGASALDAADGKDNQSLLPTLDDVLKLANEYSKLKTTYETQLKLLSLLVMQFEVAKVEEANDSLAFQVIDEPNRPVMKEWPIKRVVALVGGLLALFIAWVRILYVYYKPWMRSQLYSFINDAEPTIPSAEDAQRQKRKKYDLTRWLKRKLADPGNNPKA